MKHIIYITLIVISALCGYWIGQQSWFIDINNKPHYYNTEEALNAERKYCNATIEALHWYYRDDTTYWKERFMITKEYQKIDSINQGDWEDFYSTDW